MRKSSVYILLGIKLEKHEYSWNSDPEKAGSTKGSPGVRSGVEFYKHETDNNMVVAILA